MNDNITITFPDGNTKSVEKGISGFDLANQISKSLAKESVAIQIDGKICDLSLELNQDCRVVIIKRENEEALDIIRHDCAHVMAEAVQSLFPGTQVTIGPSIENGFYYDFARKEPFTLSDLPKIEKKMHEIVNRGEKFTREVWSRDEAINFFKGTWHGVLTPLSKPGLFAVIDRIGESQNLEEFFFDVPYIVDTL